MIDHMGSTIGMGRIAANYVVIHSDGYVAVVRGLIVAFTRRFAPISAVGPNAVRIRVRLLGFGRVFGRSGSQRDKLVIIRIAHRYHCMLVHRRARGGNCGATM